MNEENPKSLALQIKGIEALLDSIGVKLDNRKSQLWREKVNCCRQKLNRIATQNLSDELKLANLERLKAEIINVAVKIDPKLVDNVNPDQDSLLFFKP